MIVVAANPPSQGWRIKTMAWTTPSLVEICIGLEINGYMPAEF
jgi:coenzyme PQQ precursor peptide PqqA